MCEAKEVELSLKVFINKEKSKVLFAEVDNDFADVLLSFPTFPLCKIVQILEQRYGEKAPTIGCITTLCHGLQNPNMANIWTDRGKEVVQNKFIGLFDPSDLKVSVDYTMPSRYKPGQRYTGVFTPNSASYILSDDLYLISSKSRSSLMNVLSVLGIDVRDIQGAETRMVTFGSNEIIDLLKVSLLSPSPLSDLIFDMRRTKYAKTNSVAAISLPQSDRVLLNEIMARMRLTVMLQKSTGKILFAKASKEFVDVLFVLLIIPLGRVECVFGGNTGLNNIDNLYKSIAHLVEGFTCLKGKKEQVMKPQLNNVYCSDYYLQFIADKRSFYVERDPFYVNKEGRDFMVTDDLTVTPLSLSSTLSLLNKLKIPVSDVQEVDVFIGFQDVSRILKASLTSNSALTDALIIPKKKKQEPVKS